MIAKLYYSLETMDEANKAVKAYEKVQELFGKYSEEVMSADELNQSIMDRINASQELLQILTDADKARGGDNY